MLTLVKRIGLRGFNLIEAAVVLGVVGLVIGGIWVAASAVQEQRHIAQTLTNFLAIKQNVNRLITPAVASQIGDPVSSVSYSMGLYSGTDARLDGGTGNIYDGWGSYMYVSFAAVGVGNMGISLSAIDSYFPMSFCIKFLAELSSQGRSNLSNILVIGTSMTSLTSFPVIPTKAQCTDVTTLLVIYKL